MMLASGLHKMLKMLIEIIVHENVFFRLFCSFFSCLIGFGLYKSAYWPHIALLDEQKRFRCFEGEGDLLTFLFFGLKGF